MLNESSTVQELLTEIRTQKERLISEKKIKKAKSLPCITDDEKPFEIPSTWKWVRFGEVLQIINGDRGKNYPSKKELHETGDIPFISALNINDDTISAEQLLYVDKKRYDILRSGKLKKGDLVLCIRGSLGKNCRYPFETGAIASSLVIIRSYLKIDFVYDYMAYYLNSLLFKEEMSQYDNGTAQPNLGARDLSLFAVPLPPLAEQQRIVARVKSLFAKLDAAKEKVQSVLDAHEVRKAALLRDAFAGKLTTEWRANRNISYDDWRLVSIQDICHSLKYGTAKKSESSGRYVVIRMGNLFDGEIIWENLAYSNDEDDIKKYRLSPGDVLFNRTNSAALVGKTSIYRGEYPAIYAGYIIKLDYDREIVLGEFLNYVMNSAQAKVYCNKVKTDGVNQSNINAKKIGAFQFRLPTFSEQQEIVRILDKLLGKEACIKQSAESVLESIDRMKQSILARAFRGEL